MKKGQSLVEIAITLPLLIFMLIGLFEVGNVIRTYLVLVNVSREGARFLARSEYQDFTEPNLAVAINHIENSTDNYVRLNWGENSALVITRLDIDTGFPCDPDLRQEPIENDYWPNCNCEMLQVTGPYTPWQISTYVYSQTKQSRMNVPEMVQELGWQNELFNCQLMKKTLAARPSRNDVVIVEIFYEQPQLFGFPIISNPFTDPVPLYTHTAMRRIVTSRSRGQAP